MQIRALQVVVSLTALAFLTTSSTANSQISFVDMFRSDSFTQTANGSSLSLNGYFFDLDLNSVNAGDFTSATATGPGPQTPVTLSLNTGDPRNFHYQTGFYASQAAMDSDFPTGTYTLHGLGGTMGLQDATLNYTADLYPSAQPFLTGTDFSQLQGVNASSPISLHFNPFAVNAGADFQFQFFTIFDITANMQVYDAGFLPQTATGVTIASNTLAAGHNFGFELIDSNRVFDRLGTGAVFAPELGFDLRTTGTFSTAAVPEPGSLALLSASGLSAALLLLRRRSR